ncbi:hypothetical protein DFJ73DRAFT_957978 [Zopfochytrium polystomum]|nr:hypothetical protein DFJ73DRAFT_957978 [Zopfochytrium polystomum]
MAETESQTISYRTDEPAHGNRQGRPSQLRFECSTLALLHTLPLAYEALIKEEAMELALLADRAASVEDDESFTDPLASFHSRLWDNKTHLLSRRHQRTAQRGIDCTGGQRSDSKSGWMPQTIDQVGDSKRPNTLCLGRPESPSTHARAEAAFKSGIAACIMLAWLYSSSTRGTDACQNRSTPMTPPSTPPGTTLSLPVDFTGTQAATTDRWVLLSDEASETMTDDLSSDEDDNDASQLKTNDDGEADTTVSPSIATPTRRPISVGEAATVVQVGRRTRRRLQREAERANTLLATAAAEGRTETAESISMTLARLRQAERARRAAERGSERKVTSLSAALDRLDDNSSLAQDPPRHSGVRKRRSSNVSLRKILSGSSGSSAKVAWDRALGY